MDQETPKVDRSGTIVAQKYRIDKLIARGGFSSVYRADQLGMDRHVALKILEIGPGMDATTLQRFVREAKLVSQLTHPNTITIYDFGQSGVEFLYIAMEYVKGRSLARQIRKHGPLHPMDSANVCIAILRSLEEAHQLGILHRDLKPSNIMLGRDRDDELAVRVLDFGVAKLLQPDLEMNTALTQQGVFVGTPRYASPEQMKREQLTKASDIYGVGMILWECLVGRPAVEGVDFAAAVEGHLGRTPWKLPSDAFCPPGLAHVLYQALAKEPENRYQSCRDMISDIELWLGEVASQAAVNQGFEPEDSFAPEGWFGDSLSETSSVPIVSESDMMPVAPSIPSRMKSPVTESAELPRVEPVREPTMRSDIVAGLSQDMAPLIEPRPRRDVIQPRPLTPARPARGVSTKQKVIGAVVVVAVLAIALAIWRGRMKASEVQTQQVDAQTAVPSKPAVSADGLMLAMKTAGWTIRNLEQTTYSDMRQVTFMAQKERDKATVAIYEADTDAFADALLRDTKQPSESVLFGRTLVRVSPGPSDSPSGVQPLTAMLFTFRGMLEQRGDL